VLVFAKSGEIGSLTKSLARATSASFTHEQASGVSRVCIVGVRGCSLIPVWGKHHQREEYEERVYTPLMIAASYGHAEALSLLVAAGADINGKDSQVGILCCTQRPLTSVEVFCFEIFNFSAERPRS
jgi:hypothetical protein